MQFWPESVRLDTTSFPLCTFNVPVIAVILYLLATHYFQPSSTQAQCTATPTSAKSSSSKKSITKLKMAICAHNAVLCIFSGLCFYRTAPIVANIFMEHGFEGAICGKLLENLYDGGLESVYGFWSFAFYLSKFYEFIDTFIVIARGRRPMFLQTFHHCGAVLGMWAVLATRCTGGYLFVVENSLIHTVMYFYYAMSSINIRLPGKVIITQAQMIQFVVGNLIALVQLYGYSDCMRYEDKFVIWWHLIYTTCLFLLFRIFYVKTYSKRT